MRQDVTHQLVGYDPRTEALVFEQDIPRERWDQVRLLLESDPEDPDYVYSYPLDGALARDIMGIVGQRDNRALKYYIECFAQD